MPAQKAQPPSPRNLRDAVALKLLLLALPGVPLSDDDMARARNLVDDLIELVRQELG